MPGQYATQRNQYDTKKNTAQSAITFLPTTTPILMYGVLLFFIGIVLYLVGVGLVIPRYLLGLDRALRPISEDMVWYSGIPVTLGIGAVVFDLFVLLAHKRIDEPVRSDPIADKRVTVALTAYNDEESIGDAVKDFLGISLRPFADRGQQCEYGQDNASCHRSRSHRRQRTKTRIWALCIPLLPRSVSA